MSKKSIKKNYIYNVIYQLLIIIIPVVVTPYISRTLDPEGVGQYSFSLALITYFTIFATLGFGTYAQREIAKFQNDSKKQSIVFWEIFICRLIPVVLSLAVNLILTFSGIYGEYTNLMLIFSINIIAVALEVAFFFQGNEEFGKIVLINLVIKIIGTVGIFVFVKNPQDVWIYALLNSLVLFISNVSMWLLLHKKLVKVKLCDLLPLRHLSSSIRLFIPALAITLYTVLDKSLIGLITCSDAENGFYEQADKIVKMSMTLMVCLGTVMTSRNSYELEQGNVEKVRTNNYNALHFVWLLGLPLMAGNIFVAPNMVPWFLGVDFKQSILLMQILAPLILIIGISNVIGLQYLLPYHKDRQYTIAIVIGALTNLCLNIPLIYFLGALGAALATIVAELVVTSVMLIMASKHLSLIKIFAMSFKPILATILMSLVIYPLSLVLSSSILNTFIIVLCGFVVYGLSILILRDSLIVDILRSIKHKLKHSDNTKNSAEITVQTNSNAESSSK